MQWGGGTIFSDSGFFTSDQNLTQQGDGFWKLGTVEVHATGASTLLSFGAFDQQQDVILDDISVVMKDVAVDDTPAPEPATLGLIACALAGLGLLKRRRTRVTDQ